MARAIKKHFGSEPSINIDAQRAIVAMTEPKVIDWTSLDRAISRMSFTFGGAHLRTRGRVLETDGKLSFEFFGGVQRMMLKAGSKGRDLIGREITIVGRIEDCKQEAMLTIIDAK